MVDLRQLHQDFIDLNQKGKFDEDALKVLFKRMDNTFAFQMNECNELMREFKTIMRVRTREIEEMILIDRHCDFVWNQILDFK